MNTHQNRLLAFWLTMSIAIMLTGCGNDRTSQPHSASSPTTSPAATSPPVTSSPVTSSPVTQTLPRENASVLASQTSTASSVCRQCHEDQFQSYLLTDHSRSMRMPDSSKVAFAEVTHHPSHRSYDVYQSGEEIRTRQSVSLPITDAQQNAAEAQLPIGDFPIESIMGSGRFVESFILRDGKYLLQSPLGRYIKPQSYDMCPGYEGADHRGLTRVVRATCLFCHVGSLHDDNDQQPVIDEFAIGCQRCHGEGSEHVAHYQDVASKSPTDSSEQPAAKSEYKETIIHPAKLARRESESICAQCHLQGDYVIYQPGRKLWDFRPGEDFQMTRMTYNSDGISRSTAQDFVGHFDQLWKSKCYAGSDTMTCITCHDPHHAPQPPEVDTLHREQCLQCHENESCGKPLADRIRSQANRCVDCHMPKTPSDIIHAPTTNHQIGIYDANSVIQGTAHSEQPTNDTPRRPASDTLKRPASETLKRPALETLKRPASETLKRIAPPGDTLDTTRNDLLAECAWLIDYLEATGRLDRQAEIPRIKSELASHLQRHSTDAAAHASLAALLYQEILHQPDSNQDGQLWKKIQQHSTQVLSLSPASSPDRLVALKTLAESYDETNDVAKATQYYRQLTRERRRETDHYNLGLLLGKQRDFAGADSAFREAIRINGAYQNPYRSLSILYRSVDPALSYQMQEVADALQRLKASQGPKPASQLD